MIISPPYQEWNGKTLRFLGCPLRFARHSTGDIPTIFINVILNIVIWSQTLVAGKGDFRGGSISDLPWCHLFQPVTVLILRDSESKKVRKEISKVAAYLICPGATFSNQSLLSSSDLPWCHLSQPVTVLILRDGESKKVRTGDIIVLTVC